ncbi:MAG TPA: methyltransferase domain-containing protein [Candidatus Rifleibacterium sp.]|nr:methyltransferase domain-containing protein [Candidatus Rifleibacterium sp.]
MTGFSVNIDWEAIYNQPWVSSSGGAGVKATAEYWSSRAEGFARKAHHPKNRQNSEQLLDRFVWSKSETVLDIGAGPGSYAVPLAKRVGSVTALDVSAGMLDQLQQWARVEGVSNITTITDSWLGVPEEQVSGFDTLICFNALGCAALLEDGTCHMGRALAKMAGAARRGFTLVPLADLPVDRPMLQALEMPFTASRRERVALLFHIMVKAGLLPDVEILARPFFWAFESLEEGVELLAARIGIQDDGHRRSLLLKYLETQVEKVDSTLILQYPVHQALFKWQKEE